jgi:hypothetical protein
MITIQKGELCICIPHPSPKQCKEDIIRAIAAAIRWRANYTDNYNGDDFNLSVLSQLLEELTVAA